MEAPNDFLSLNLKFWDRFLEFSFETILSFSLPTEQFDAGKAANPRDRGLALQHAIATV